MTARHGDAAARPGVSTEASSTALTICSNPPSVSDEEVRAITQQMEEGAIKPKPRVSFSVGENVKVVDGPFADFNGVVEEVKPDKGKLRVLISIFGRATPVELEFVQVERN